MISATKASALLKLIRFDKPIGTLLLLWPTLWALWIAASGVPDIKLLLVFMLGTFLMRSAGCVANDLADRDLDGAVARTHNRPLITGAVTVTEAIVLALVLCLLAFALVLTTNNLTILLSLAAVVLTACYPLMKRVTQLPQLVLGLAFSWSIPMAFAAQTGSLPAGCWLLFIGNVLWTIVYDTQYAMVDRDDDIKIGIKSTAILFGNADRAVIGVLQIMCLLAYYLGSLKFELGIVFYTGLATIALLFIYHQYLIRNREATACFRAFKHNNWVGLVMFASVVVDYALTNQG
ncbi:MAG: 4-hydroxybenzoate polyprenyltransferase [Halieaceae bacterium]|jgi:4-hydroxybenzoate polyprenyltransferase